MTDILTRLSALSFEHSSIPEAKEYIRRGFGFTASAGNRRRHLSDEEMNALTTAFRLRDDTCRSLIALVQEAAKEIERLRKLAAETRDALDAAAMVNMEKIAAENERLRNMLHEGLNLCVRARKLNKSIKVGTCREMGSYHPDHVNCGTPHLWVLEQYDTDLAAWELAARKALNPQEPA